MKILHIIKEEADASTKKIIELMRTGNDVTIIELCQKPVSYDELVAKVFAADKVFCW